MTGYESKRAMAQDKLAQPEQEPASVTYKEVQDSMNALEKGDLRQQVIAEELGQRKLYTAPPQRTEQEPIVGTKTWFEDGKVVTQHLTAKDIYKEPEQEPTAWFVKNNGEPLLGAEPSFYLEVVEEILAGQIDDSGSEIAPLYSHPQRPWVGLTAEEAAECWTTSATQTWKNFEAKLKEKNNE